MMSGIRCLVAQVSQAMSDHDKCHKMSGSPYVSSYDVSFALRAPSVPIL